MRIAILNNCVPFVRGGAEYLAESLCAKLREYGHDAILIRVPLEWEPPSRLLESILSCRLLRLPNIQRVVGLKFPAYYVRHPDKRLWILHQFRQVYDLWGTEFQGLPDTPEGGRIRDIIQRCDNLWLREASKIYVNSPVTQHRLKRFNGLDAEVLYPPLWRQDHFRSIEYGDYVFYPSRLSGAKRQRLAVEAMVHVTTPVRLIVAGPPDTEQDHRALTARIEALGVSDRVALIARWISEEEKADWMGRALACAYLPYDEDSYGFVCLEAYAAAKPVITCTDSGGTLALVHDQRTGLVVPPEPRALAAAMDRLYRDRAEARRMGEEGRAVVTSMGISWERVVRALAE